MEIFEQDILPSVKGVFLVGGCVRDILLGLNPVDYDMVVVNKDPESFSREMAEKLSARVIQLGRNDNRIYRIMAKTGCFDISPAFGGHIHSDLLNRDYTLNAIGYSVELKEYTDVTGGIDDLNKKMIRKVSDDVFKKDPVRLLRGFRIAAGCGFTIEPGTLESIQRDVALIQSAAKERIKAEWFKLLAFPNSFYHVSAMAQTGLLFELFPELNALKDCGQNRYHAFNVWDHTLAAFEALEPLIHHSFQVPGLQDDLLSSHFRKDQRALLKYAMLLHDIGKPETKSAHEDGTIHFYRHASTGAALTLKINTRLRASNREKDYIYEMVRHHNRPLQLFVLHARNSLRPKNIIRFFMDCRGLVPDLLLHSLADNRGKGLPGKVGYEDFVWNLLSTYFLDFKSLQDSPPPIQGNDLIERFNLSPSPLFKVILNRVKEAWFSGEIKNRNQALELVKKILADQNHTQSQ
jgi:putative nucleotidyltransferase with HDIG domain